MPSQLKTMMVQIAALLPLRPLTEATDWGKMATEATIAGWGCFAEHRMIESCSSPEISNSLYAE